VLDDGASITRESLPSGTYPLLFGRDSEGTVVVANFDSAKVGRCRSTR